MADPEAIRAALLRHALSNAIKYGGKANPNAVAGMAFSEDPSLKANTKDVFRLAAEVASEVNRMGLDAIKAKAESMGVGAPKEKPKQVERILPALPNASKFKIIKVRFAPNPDSVIHLGNTRAALLSDDYAKMYGGSFVLRFEDTSPSIKPPQAEAYEIIRQDLKWLGVHWDEEAIQSDRLPIYSDHARRLIELGGAYICTCKAEAFRALVTQKKPCPCRDLPPSGQLERWGRMLSGKIRRGGAVMRVKTDLEHPNPAIRDWPAMRIDTASHPRIGKKYRVWPLYNFASGIDDHLMGITHILRGKEHEVNMHRQKYMYRYFGWDYPEAIHYGRLKIVGTVLSKSKIRAGIESGLYKDWSDPRLGTIAALRRRGFVPETIRRLILECGVRPSEATISWENVDAINRKILDPLVKRYVYLADPVAFEIEGIPKAFTAKMALHPDHPEWGAREFAVSPESPKISLPSGDLAPLKKGSAFRLMNLFNVEVTGAGRGRFVSEDVADAKRLGAHIIQWMPQGLGAPLDVVRPDASVHQGSVDPAALGEAMPSSFQFYRYGFVRVYREGDGFVGYFTHG